MTTFIFLNGPRQVGKDRLASALVEEQPNSRILPIMWPLKEEAVASVGLQRYAAQIFEAHKDTPRDELKGRTPRELYIEYGQRMRAEHGEDYPINKWVLRAKVFTGYKYVIAPDVRFQPEVDVAARVFGAHNLVLVRVHREDYGWTNDIGSYLKHFMSIDFQHEENERAPRAGARLMECIKARAL